MRVLVVILSHAVVLLGGISTDAQPLTPLPADPPRVAAEREVNSNQRSATVASTDARAAAADRVTAWRESTATDLARLVEDYQGAGRAAEAQRVNDWVIEPPSDGQLLFLRRPVLSSEPTEAEPLAQRFFDLRQQRAEQLYVEAQAAAQAGDCERAYQRLFEVLREDPHHAAAGKTVGIQNSAVRVTAGKTRHDKLKWKAGSYWRAHSEHFTVTTNHSQQAALAMAELLEQLHQVWRQLFVRHWTTPHAVRQAFAGRALVWPTRRRHSVVLFADRSQFIKHLKPLEPHIDVALGVYRDKDRTSYFYEGEAELQSTWLHEATHQLFQETVPARPGAGASVDFWMIEAIAMYLESTRFAADYATVGGNHAARLEVARHRALEEGFYLPIHVLSELGKDELQQHHDIRRLYTQSAGLAHFLMDHDDRRFRQGFLQAISDLYRSPRRNDPLWERLEVPSSKLDESYRQFLRDTAAASAN